MGWLDDAWGGVKKGASAVSGAGSDFVDYFYNKPADAQKKGLKDLANKWTDFGGQQRDWYGNQGAGIDQTFGQTGTDIDTLRREGGTNPLQGAEEWKILRGYEGPQQQRDFYGQLKTDPSLRPHEQQDYYGYLDGNKDALTNQEDLYNQRKGGTDPAANYEDTRALEGINRQLAARGGYANTAGERQITDYYANVGAQRSHDLAGLAAGADSSRLGKNGQLGGAASGASGEQDAYGQRLGSAAQGASGEEESFNKYATDLGHQIGQDKEKQLTDIIDRDQTLATHRADIMQKMTELGGAAMGDAQKEAFAAELAALGVDPAKIKDILGFFGGVVKTGATIAGS